MHIIPDPHQSGDVKASVSTQLPHNSTGDEHPLKGMVWLISMGATFELECSVVGWEGAQDRARQAERAVLNTLAGFGLKPKAITKVNRPHRAARTTMSSYPVTRSDHTEPCLCRTPRRGPLYWDWRCTICSGYIVSWWTRRKLRKAEEASGAS